MSYHSYRMMLRDARQHYERQDYDRALAILQTIATSFPEHEPRALLWQSMIYSLKGLPGRGIECLQQALNRGYWYPPAIFDTDPDAAGLHDQPDYPAILREFERRMQAARTSAAPDILVIEPEGMPTPWPLLIALHGNNQNAHNTCEYWWHATSAGMLTALPQSSQVSGPNVFVWDQDDRTQTEITRHLTDIQAHYPVDPEALVVGGFSRGAEAAILMALTGVLPAVGFIAVSPGGPMLGEPSRWEAVLARNTPPANLRGVIMIGEQDPYYPGALRLAEILGVHGVSCWLDSIADLDHNFPEHFNAHLDTALKFLSE